MLPTPNSNHEKILIALYNKLNGNSYSLPSAISTSEKILAEIVKSEISVGGGGGGASEPYEHTHPISDVEGLQPILDTIGSGGGGEVPEDLLQRLELLEHYMKNVFNPLNPESNSIAVDFETFRNDARFVVADNAYPWAVDKTNVPYSLTNTNKGINSTTSSTSISFRAYGGVSAISYDIMGSSEGSDKLSVTISDAVTRATITTFAYSGTTQVASWQTVKYSLPPGYYTVTFSYVKDGSVHTAFDGFHIRNLRLIGGNSTGSLNL